jgi:hypothetical protein
MGLVSHALAFGLGYLLGRPGGRQQVVQLGHQVTELAEKPEVKRLAARGRELANDRAHAAKDAVTARVSGKTADSGAVATPATPAPGAAAPAAAAPASPPPSTSPRADAPPTVPAPSSRPPAPSDG